MWVGNDRGYIEVTSNDMIAGNGRAELKFKYKSKKQTQLQIEVKKFELVFEVTKG